MTRLKWVWTRGYRSKGALEAILARAGVDPNEGDWDFAVEIHGWKGSFDIADPRWKALSDEVERAMGRPPYIGEFIKYTHEEVVSAHLVELRPGGISKGESGPAHGNTYDLRGACPRCLTGARVLPPFRIENARDLPRKRLYAATNNGEILVTGPLADTLAGIPGSGNWLLPVEERRSGRALPWRAIAPRAIMPPVHPSTCGLAHGTTPNPKTFWSCEVCKRDCFAQTRHVALEMAYSRGAIERACAAWLNPETGLPDVAATWEGMGPGNRPEGGKNQVPTQFILLAGSAARAFLGPARKGSNGFVLAPVTLVE